MGQDVPFPIVEGEQFVDAYHMTPVNLYLFGVNDNARPDGHEYTNAYIWSEADGRQGANNIFLACLKILRSEVSFRSQTFDRSMSWQITTVVIIKTKMCSVFSCDLLSSTFSCAWKTCFSSKGIPRMLVTGC